MNETAERPSLYSFEEGESVYGPQIPKEFTVDKLTEIGDVVYRLEEYGNLKCGEIVTDTNYVLKNAADKNGWHSHIIANVAGLMVGDSFKNEYGDTIVSVEFIEDSSIMETIKKYLVEEKGACPTAVNFQN